MKVAALDLRPGMTLDDAMTAVEDCLQQLTAVWEQRAAESFRAIETAMLLDDANHADALDEDFEQMRRDDAVRRQEWLGMARAAFRQNLEDHLLRGEPWVFPEPWATDVTHCSPRGNVEPGIDRNFAPGRGVSRFEAPNQ